MLGSGPTLAPLLNEGLNFGLVGQRVLPPELLPEHRLPKLKKLEGGSEPLSDQLLWP